jgi:hypothetical protein
MGRELTVLVDAGAEQPPQLLGSSGYSDARLVRRDLGGVWKPLSVAAHLEQLARRLIGRLCSPDTAHGRLLVALLRRPIDLDPHCPFESGILMTGNVDGCIVFEAIRAAERAKNGGRDG